ncbi:MAG: hypothetical protein NTZ46_09920 [Verrucomicrobia bacterium]|nr:hypothetical protein [Verrucomicrobiota bacterium]
MAKDAGFWYQNLPADPNRAKNRIFRGGAAAEQGFCTPLKSFLIALPGRDQTGVVRSRLRMVIHRPGNRTGGFLRFGIGLASIDPNDGA